MAKAKLGRPSQLTPKLKKDFLDAIAAGSHYEPACAYVGISYSTFRIWMQRGQGTHKTRKTSQEFVDFVEAVQGAEAKGEISAIAAIRGATKKDWRSAAWMLERRHPDRWSVTQKIQLQLEAELNAIYDKIENDETIPLEYKKAVFAALAAAGESTSSQD